MSEEEYFVFERDAPEKHEYYGGRVRGMGEVRAMAGAQPPHNVLSFRLHGLIFSQLDERGCSGFTSDQRVQVRNASSYLYPDFSALCGEAEYNQDKSPALLVNPALIVEVVSKSTADKDRGEKFMLYRQLPSLRQYLLLDSTTIHAELHTRQPATDHWLLTETRELSAVLDLSSVGCTLPLARLYQGVGLSAGG